MAGRRTWPPWATAAIRAARLTSSPTRLSPPMLGASPALMPIRTRIDASSGHGSVAIARWAATAAATADARLLETTKNESPSVPCSCPPLRDPRGAQQRLDAARGAVRMRSRPTAGLEVGSSPRYR